jgi:predicted phosphoribosyltransferase
MVAALRSIRPLKPEKLVAAMAVAPPGAVERMKREADEVVCLSTPADFYAVGQFFSDFRQVTDEEVTEILARASAHSVGAE